LDQPARIRFLCGPVQTIGDQNELKLGGVLIFPRGHDPLQDLPEEHEISKRLAELFPGGSSSLTPFLTTTELQRLCQAPASKIPSVRCNKLYVSYPPLSPTTTATTNINTTTTVLLLGDAAHAMSAYLGEGCNSALQDAYLFAKYLGVVQEDKEEKYYNNNNNNEVWAAAVKCFAEQQLSEVHAIEEMSYYATPPTKWLRTQFLLRLMLRNFLLNKLWLPKALVSWFVHPLPMELLGGEDIPAYVDVLCQTGWWVACI